MKAFSFALALTAVSSCVGVAYQRAGQPVAARAGHALVVTRVRFFHDTREFFPWNVSLLPSGGATNTERHLWLLRFHPRGVTAELHPNADGSLAIWLASGDYALVGSSQLPAGGAAPYEVVALLRVPPGAVTTYAGELTFATATHEGWYAARGVFGDATVIVLPTDTARAGSELRVGTLPQPPVVSRWCAGELLPRFSDPKLGERAKTLLDNACGDRDSLAVGVAQPDTNDPARVAIYDVRDTLVGHLMLGKSTVADAARLVAGLGGLGPRRDNEVTFHFGSAMLRPRVLYTPPATMHQLYFAKDTLIMVVAGVPRGLPATRLDFAKRFPTARETHRESMWYELQTQLSACVWLIAVFNTSSDRLDSNGYATVCSK